MGLSHPANLPTILWQTSTISGLVDIEDFNLFFPLVGHRTFRTTNHRESHVAEVFSQMWAAAAPRSCCTRRLSSHTYIYVYMYIYILHKSLDISIYIYVHVTCMYIYISHTYMLIYIYIFTYTYICRYVVFLYSFFFARVRERGKSFVRASVDLPGVAFSVPVSCLLQGHVLLTLCALEQTRCLQVCPSAFHRGYGCVR